MKIALIHFRVGETDGVSLEMDKWRKVLANLGHEPFFIAGKQHGVDTFTIPELAFDNREDLELNEACFVRLGRFTEESLKSRLEAVANSIEKQLTELIKEKSLDMLIVNNMFSLARSLPVAIGIQNSIIKTGVKAVGHHHDFYWERERYSSPTCAFVRQCLEDFFPPFSNMLHVVINSLAQTDLKFRKGLTSTIVPNVFDFDQDPWTQDDYNIDLRQAYGLDENAVIFLQATRVVNRKGIELAVQTLAEMNKSKSRYFGKKMYNGVVFDDQKHFVLLCVGLHEGTDGYESKLEGLAAKLDVEIILDPTKIAHTRSNSVPKRYSLWDAYVIADVVSYPSLYEGFGNQFLEAVFAKKPILLYEYSVFEADIKAKGFAYASLGAKHSLRANGLAQVTEESIVSASNVLEGYLFDPIFRNEAVENNFELGKKHYSMEALKNLLKEIVNN
ncbi:MAG: glycosyltransferase family 4 protein [Bacilli bacterium]|nr:glycosyltransferase family 4 protein [Bacilli bacterium]MBN2696395.1 glycosyltransferase family 4 protein [Bacilli bacterium]